MLRERGPKAVSPLSVPLLMGNAAAGAVAMRHGLRGPTFGVMSACAAGAHAIGQAMRMIESGEADAVVTGGAEAALAPIAIAAFAAMGATSQSGISRPFDARRDGFVMGEGAGVIVLEAADALEGRGGEPIGELLGYGATSDAFHLTAPEPSGRDAARAIRLALADAGVEPAEVDYVNAHGTSTPLNDRGETEAIKTPSATRPASTPISSTKSVIGHLLGAAGAVEAIATLEALRRRIAPPTVGWDERDAELDLDYVPGAPRPLAGGRSASRSPTPSASAATTRSSAWRHERRPRHPGGAGAGASPRARAARRAARRLCDPGSFSAIRSAVRSAASRRSSRARRRGRRRGREGRRTAGVLLLAGPAVHGRLARHGARRLDRPRDRARRAERRAGRSGSSSPAAPGCRRATTRSPVTAGSSGRAWRCAAGPRRSRSSAGSRRAAAPTPRRSPTSS